MNQLHVGRGMTRGAMTVFPLWSNRAGLSRYTTHAKYLDVSEMDGGPDVSTLMVGNVGDRPLLVLEGQLFEGGWQHRMAVRSMMIGVHQRIPVEVACVEQGRWHGSARQHSRGRRVTPYVRDAVRAGGDLQGEVWSRVAVHTQEVAGNATGSFVHRLDAAAAEPSDWRDYRPLAGQCGVLIGIGGQPYVAEVFDSITTLRRQLPAILEAAALDAGRAPAVPTPGRRARRFIDRIESLQLTPAGEAGLGERVEARSQYADVAGLRWKDRDVHVRMSNVRHPMLVGA